MAETQNKFPETVNEVWLFLLHAHDRCRSSDGKIILHRLMVRVIEAKETVEVAASTRQQAMAKEICVCGHEKYLHGNINEPFVCGGVLDSLEDCPCTLRSRRSYICRNERTCGKSRSRNKKREVTPEQKQNYLDDRGRHCPHCGSIETKGADLTWGGDGPIQEIRCLSCNKKWIDIYKQTDVAEIVQDESVSEV